MRSVLPVKRGPWVCSCFRSVSLSLAALVAAVVEVVGRLLALLVQVLVLEVVVLDDGAGYPRIVS